MADRYTKNKRDSKTTPRLAIAPDAIFHCETPLFSARFTIMQWYYLDANQQQIPADESELGNLLQDGTIGADTQLWNETMPEWQTARSLWPDWFPDAAEAEQAAAGGGGKLRAPALVSKRSATVGLVKRPIQTSSGSGSGGGGGKSQRLSGKTTQRTGSGKPGRGGSSRVVEEDDEDSNPELIKQLAKNLTTNTGWIKFVGVMSIIGGVVTCLTVVGALVGWLPIWLGVVLMKAANHAETAAYRGYRDEMEEALTRLGFYFKLIGIAMLSYIALYGIAIAVVISTGLFAIGAAASSINGMQPGGVPTTSFPADTGFPPAPQTAPPGIPTTPEAPVPAPAAPGATPDPAAPAAPAAPAPAPASGANPPATPAPPAAPAAPK